MSFVRPSALRLLCRQQTGHVMAHDLCQQAKYFSHFFLLCPSSPLKRGQASLP